jgi:hypothetical protein
MTQFGPQNTLLPFSTPIPKEEAIAMEFIWRTQGRRKRNKHQNSSSPTQTSEKKILELSEGYLVNKLTSFKF